MSRRHGNSAIIAVGGRRRTGLDGGKVSYGTHAAFASFKRDFDRRLQATGVHLLKPKNLKPRHIETVPRTTARRSRGGHSFAGLGEELVLASARLRAADRSALSGAPDERRIGLRTAGLRAFGEQSGGARRGAPGAGHVPLRHGESEAPARVRLAARGSDEDASRNGPIQGDKLVLA